MSENRMQTTGLRLKTYGIDVSKYDDSFLNSSIQKGVDDTLCGSREDYIGLLGSDEREKSRFKAILHNNYSEFFRNTLTFSVIERIILPELTAKKRALKNSVIRIWSAACAGGQEPYSLAMVIEEYKNGQQDRLRYHIFATDQDESQVILAQRGQYIAGALSNLSMRRIQQWFTKEGDVFKIKPELKECLDFSVFDLFSDRLSSPPASIFGDFDLVFCANLLFYYKPEFRAFILAKMEKCLANGGYLVTGETEREILTRYGYREVFPQSAIFRVKEPVR